MWEMSSVLAILFIGSFIQGASGFGFGLFSMGLLPLLLPLKSSTLLVLALTVIISLHIVIKFRKSIRVKDLFFILIASWVGRVFSFFFLNLYGDMNFMKKVLGLVLIGMVIYLFMSKREGDPPGIWKKPLFGILIGFIGGFIGGVFAVGGPFFVFYFLMRYTDKTSYNANLQATFVFTNLFTMILHGLHGDFYPSFYLYFLYGIVVVLLGANLGLRWFQSLPHTWIKKIATVIVLAAGVNLLLFS